MVICEICKKNTNTIFSICKCNLFNICEECYKILMHNINTNINLSIFTPMCNFCRNQIDIKFNFNRFFYYSSILYSFFKLIILYATPMIYPIYKLSKNMDFLNIGIIIYTIIILDTFNFYILVKKKLINYDYFILIRLIINTIFLSMNFFLNNSIDIYILSYILPFYLIPFIIISGLYSYSVLKKQYNIIKNNYININIKLNN